MSARHGVFLSVAVLLGALAWFNARFVMLAFETQPDCVAHERGDPGGTPRADTAHRAAKSSC